MSLAGLGGSTPPLTVKNIFIDLDKQCEEGIKLVNN
tara:strand:- start:974 stop:1081 length:108 start_codon:yes stop_codon:yes gene_type:complete